MTTAASAAVRITGLLLAAASVGLIAAGTAG
jgi:hypothetical protein